MAMRQTDLFTRSIPKLRKSYDVLFLGNPSLKMTTFKFDFSDSVEGAHERFDALETTLRENGFFGLSAPQVGWNEKLFAMEVFDENNIIESKNISGFDDSTADKDYGKELDLDYLFNYWNT
eukprot:UN06805